jgi:long-chain fatty acid transport protein
LSGTGTGNVGESFNIASGSYKRDLNDQVSLALIWDQPFGSSINYDTPAATTALGGTQAQVSSNAVTAIARYKFDGGFSVHGGLRAQTIGGNLALSGRAFVPDPNLTPEENARKFTSYELDLANDTSFGYSAGVAYERPDIALRVSLTYNSKIDHSFASSQSVAGRAATNVTTDSATPESWYLEFQSGIAANTLVFGSVRYSPWSKFALPAAGLGDINLASLSDSTDYTLGVGRKLNDTWSISAVYGQSGGGTSATAYALSPTGGNKSLALAAVYTNDVYKVTTGVRYTKLGDTTATVGTAQTPVASFAGNSAVSVGLSVAYTF